MSDQNTPLPPLSPRHERFVLEYLRDGNATQAYIRAGYSRRGAQPSASRLLRQPHIEAAIAAGQQRIAAALEISVERLGREYARIAFANIDDFVRVEADGRLRVDLDKASQAQRARIVELKIANHSKPEQTVTLKLGKLKALEMLTHRVGLFARKPEPVPTARDDDTYKEAFEKMEEDWEDTIQLLGETAAELDKTRAALAAAEARLAAAVPVTPPGRPQAHAEAAAAPPPRGEGEIAGECPATAPEEPPPIMLKGMGPPYPPKQVSQPPSQSPPQPLVAGAGNGRIFWNTERKPPSGPTWHDIIRNSKFPGW